MPKRKHLESSNKEAKDPITTTEEPYNDAVTQTTGSSSNIHEPIGCLHLKKCQSCCSQCDDKFIYKKLYGILAHCSHCSHFSTAVAIIAVRSTASIFAVLIILAIAFIPELRLGLLKFDLLMISLVVTCAVFVVFLHRASYHSANMIEAHFNKDLLDKARKEKDLPADGRSKKD